MEVNRKTIQINPELFKINGGNTTRKKQRKPKDDYDNNFETILYRNKELQNKVKNAKDKVNFKNYIVLFNEIRKKLIDVVQKLKKFVDADKKVEKNQIYDFVE